MSQLEEIEARIDQSRRQQQIPEVFWPANWRQPEEDLRPYIRKGLRILNSDNPAVVRQAVEIIFLFSQSPRVATLCASPKLKTVEKLNAVLQTTEDCLVQCHILSIYLFLVKNSRPSPEDTRIIATSMIEFLDHPQRDVCTCAISLISPLAPFFHFCSTIGDEEIVEMLAPKMGLMDHFIMEALDAQGHGNAAREEVELLLCADLVDFGFVEGNWRTHALESGWVTNTLQKLSHSKNSSPLWKAHVSLLTNIYQEEEDVSQYAQLDSREKNDLLDVSLSEPIDEPLLKLLCYVHRVCERPLLNVEDWKRILEVYPRLQSAEIFESISVALSGHDVDPEQFRGILNDPRNFVVSLEDKLVGGRDVSATITMMSWLLRGDAKLAGNLQPATLSTVLDNTRDEEDIQKQFFHFEFLDNYFKCADDEEIWLHFNEEDLVELAERVEEFTEKTGELGPSPDMITSLSQQIDRLLNGEEETKATWVRPAITAAVVTALGVTAWMFVKRARD
ncbi:hypothetical protein PROFUN_08900 [Planoprotostelium fungivorum]|uniref:Uncharacterized protein n=1 Tax=Planoprotostelium fungivorum TaxID=1890364 RepID=A0A2P6NIV9_9EUKA|nr:hypothetical protein PROFUN_08900 [Planoprotostelium fungivorum]